MGVAKRIAYSVLGVLAAVAGIVGVWSFVFRQPEVKPEDVLVGYDEKAHYTGLTIQYSLIPCFS